MFFYFAKTHGSQAEATRRVGGLRMGGVGGRSPPAKDSASERTQCAFYAQTT